MINVQAALQQVEALLRAGKGADAARLCKQLRKNRVDGPALLKLEGIAAFMLGHHAEAAKALGRFCDMAPNDSGSLAILGNVQQALGKPERAATAFRRVLALEPNAAPIHYNLGNALLDLGDYAAAAESFGRAMALQPNYAKAMAGQAQALAALGQDEAAVAAYVAALTVDPDMAQAHTNLGSLLQGLGRFAEAAAAHSRAVALKPDFAEAHTNLGNALQDLGRLDEAVAAHSRAVALAPRQARCHNNLGAALFAVARQKEAAECYEKALSLAPDMKAWRNLLAAALYRDDLDHAGLEKVQRRFGRAFDQRPGKMTPVPCDGPIRVGYLTSDFKNHPVAGNMLPVLERMNRAAFPIHVYANQIRSDAMSERIRALAAGWTDIGRMSDAEAAERIRADGIHILVSLAGHFDENRPTICAHRAAPVQISLHDVATSGLAAMDYIIGDSLLLPRGSPEVFSERQLRLPHFYVADLPGDLPPLRDPDGSAGPVFCCFNNPSKIGPATLAAWGRILGALPDARLVLKYQGRYGNREIRERFITLLIQAGAKAEQVVMLDLSEPFAAFLDRYNDADLALDPFPFSGSTTTFQALCMGVPVLTWPWQRMVSRWTASMLEPLELNEFIADSADDYVARAVAFAAGRAQWRARRAALRARLAASSLCDGSRWARHLERLYGAVWRRHLAKTQAR
ncbi:hypothetical protein CU669_03360 [Paramagnetospirillum kuznetsovii]|uniref:protein O-GlcNAc transferase n=1 Tax=Paramagnetospirillum kuznetsovii TaxID=2053833 RepID=A0A364P1I4_9PROT|nr:glycosyltransferase family 41 protein [Paramagnetospirillum kuznetsovii]RAU23209.1 hypothetical protein CU669_03360 [Paramagnetospirillum kuznetsovii]